MTIRITSQHPVSKNKSVVPCITDIYFCGATAKLPALMTYLDTALEIKKKHFALSVEQTFTALRNPHMTYSINMYSAIGYLTHSVVMTHRFYNERLTSCTMKVTRDVKGIYATHEFKEVDCREVSQFNKVHEDLFLKALQHDIVREVFEPYVINYLSDAIEAAS